MTAAAAGPFRPIIAGMHPDPSICRVGPDYYLACSSFEYFPGVPIWHSTDLHSWQLLGNALDRPEQLPLDGVAASQGIYAPTLRHHDDLFWLITTVVGRPGHRIFTAADPTGPWSDPVVLDVEGIDPDLAWDDDGTCYVTWTDNHSGGDILGIKQVRADPRTGKVLSDQRSLWSGTGLQLPEAPHLYLVEGWWYLLIAEGGTSAGHAISISRSRSPEGPFEGSPHNPILSHRSLSHPVQNTGHGDLVRTTQGGWAMVLLGVRPQGGFPMFHLLGRETFLADVNWVDGWPTVELAPGNAPDDVVRRDDSFGDDLSPCWLSVRTRPPESWSLTDHPGWLRLSVPEGSSDTFLPSMLSSQPDQVTLGFEVDGRLVELASIDGRYLSTEVAGGFTGRVVGPYVGDGSLLVDWVEYSGSDR